MRGSLLIAAVAALAGAALIALVFLTWWSFGPDPGEGPTRTIGESFGGGSVLGYLNVYAPGDDDVSAWDGLRGGAMLWLAAGVLAIGLGLSARLPVGPRTRRRLGAATAAAGVIALLVAIVRIVDPPFDAYDPRPAAFAGAALMAVIVACGTVAARREQRSPPHGGGH